MIVGKIIGGLGNQMFQYSFYKYLSVEKKCNLKLDLSLFDTYDLHYGYELEKVFGIREELASSSEVNALMSKYPLLFKIENKIFNKNYCFGSFHFKENNFYIDNKIFYKKYNNFYVEGYFQTNQYINKINDEMKQLFQFKTILSSRESDLISGNSISIHIRGGDYLTNPQDKKLFGNICTKEYYKRAIRYMQTKIQNPKFIVFTNDNTYAKSIFEKFDYNLYIVDWNKDENSYRDMHLMSQCKHNIIANSSFSWWGAWLNKNPNKSVISPSEWLNNQKINQDNIIPKNWIKING